MSADAKRVVVASKTGLYVHELEIAKSDAERAAAAAVDDGRRRGMLAEPTLIVAAFPGPVAMLSVHPRASICACICRRGRTVLLYDIEKKRVARQGVLPDGSDTRSVAFSSDGRMLAVGLARSKFSIFRVGSFKEDTTSPFSPNHNEASSSSNVDGQHDEDGDNNFMDLIATQRIPRRDGGPTNLGTNSRSREMNDSRRHSAKRRRRGKVGGNNTQSRMVASAGAARRQRSDTKTRKLRRTLTGNRSRDQDHGMDEIAIMRFSVNDEVLAVGAHDTCVYVSFYDPLIFSLQ